ncbi:hypothetical protein QJS04_geneDACA012043 [Acorus gramineus]|uniref:Uncharacterized protein n=1 Tax=Acorus gramineus TaxID=55184 RepID=A0AAV9B9J0_ACOGR|nr:hypothetical protein QJS04_geneDACA012043 [Acorus gramineus]
MRFLAMKLQPQLLSTTTIKRSRRHVVTKQGGLSQVPRLQPSRLPHPRPHRRRVFQANGIRANGGDHFFAKREKGWGKRNHFLLFWWVLGGR